MAKDKKKVSKKNKLVARPLGEAYVKQQLLAVERILKEVLMSTPMFGFLLDLTKIEYDEANQCLNLENGSLTVYFYSTVREQFTSLKKKPQIVHGEEFSLQSNYESYSHEDGPQQNEIELGTCETVHGVVHTLLLALTEDVLNDVVDGIQQADENRERLEINDYAVEGDR